MAGWIVAEGEASESARLQWRAGVIEINRVHAACSQRLRKIHEDGPRITLVLKRYGAQENFVDLERLGQVELDARAVLEHLEPDGVFAADELLFRIYADVEMVEEQIIVGAIGPISAAQNIEPGRLAMAS